MLTKIGIITALRAEAHCLSREKLSPGRPHDISERLSLVLSGMGESNVGSAIESLLKHGVEGFISFGTAGALCDGIKAGDIVIPKNIVDANGAIHSVSSSWQEHLLQSLAKCRAAIHEGDLLTANTVISGPAEKNRLHNKSKAIAVDMESAQICAAATTANMPTVALRFIVDDASMTIHDAILKNTDAYGHHAVNGKVHMHDLHATILHQLGLDHEKLTYRYDGRDFRLTDVHGKVVKDIIA